MGEGTPDVETDPTPEQLEHEVEHIRNGMTHVVRELDRRRHEWFDWRLQVREHALELGLAAIGAACVATGFAVVAAMRKRRKKRLRAKLEMYGAAISRMIAHPERVAPPRQTLASKAASAAATALIGAAARAVAARLEP